MLVEQLIAELLKMPPKAVAVVNLGKNDLANGKTVNSVALVEAVRYEPILPEDRYHMDYYPLALDKDEEKSEVVNICG